MRRLADFVLEWFMRDRGAIMLLGAIVLGFFSPLLVNPNEIVWASRGSDIESNHWQELSGFGESIRDGRIPLWSPLVALGRPLAGDPDSLFMYPPTFLFALLPPTLAFNVFDVAHIFLAGLFTFLFLRKGYGLSCPAALLGGVSFAFMPKMMAHLAVGHIGVISGLAWAPAVFLALKFAFDGSLLAAALAGFALALQVPTHLYVPFHTGFMASGFWLLYLLPAAWRRDWRQVIWLITVYGVWLISAALLSSVVIAPFIELLPYNTRSELSLADANMFALMPPLLLTLLAPPRTAIHEWVIFLGVLPPLLALFALRYSRRSDKWPLALFACFALVYALGAATPLFGLVRAILPGFDKMRVPTRLWFFGGFAVSLLFAFGVECLRDEDLRLRLSSKRGWLLRGAGIYIVGGAAAYATYYTIFRQWHIQIIVQIVVVVITTFLGWRWLNARISGRALQWAIVPVLCLDLLPLGASYISLINPQEAFLKSTPEEAFVLASSGIFRVYSPTGDLSFGLMGDHERELLEGQLGFQIDHSIEAIKMATGCARSGYAISVPICLDDPRPSAIPDARRLGLLNVRYVVMPQSFADPNFKLVSGDSAYVYENLLWQPRARVSPEGTARVDQYYAGKYEIVADMPVAGTLVVSETWLPGWQATATNGQAYRIERAEDALIGVHLGAGHHQIYLEYMPLAWQIGWPISMATLVALLVWIGFALRKKIIAGVP